MTAEEMQWKNFDDEWKAMKETLERLLQRQLEDTPEKQAREAAEKQAQADARFDALIASIDAHLSELARFIAEHITNNRNDGSTVDSDHETDSEENYDH